MHRVTYSMGMSLDGYIVGPDGRFDWSEPDEELFGQYLEELKATDVHLLGRRLYETMLYWETIDHDPPLSALEQEWGEVWRRLPKVVFSTTLTSVQGNTRLLSGGLVAEIERLRAEPGEGDIALGGAGLAAAVAEAGLLDEYRPRVHPVIVGAGTPYFPQRLPREDLELVDNRTVGASVVFLRYRVVRPRAGEERPGEERAGT